jgi:hypothetical protein
VQRQHGNVGSGRRRRHHGQATTVRCHSGNKDTSGDSNGGVQTTINNQLKVAAATATETATITVTMINENKATAWQG